jgi:crotonobetainyl-CoA:carnitine CoA-transferase CaiB-like acyl-CoA transferase
VPTRKAFDGIRVYDASQGVAGPHATMLLALHGADVIKVEPPEGDWCRVLGKPSGEYSIHFLAYNRGKRSISFDLRQKGGREISQRIARECNVIVESFRPGVASRIGLNYDELRKARSDIVYMSVSGFGQAGPYRERPAVDGLIQAFSGMMTMNATVDGNPHRTNMVLIDVITGLYAFQALSAAIIRQLRFGEGSYIDASLMQSAAALQAAKIMEYKVEGPNPPPQYVPSGIFDSKDGRMLVSAMRTSHYHSLCEVVRRLDLRDDPRFATTELRVENRSALLPELRGEFVKAPTAEWIEKLQAVGVMAEEILNYGDWLENGHVNSVRAYSNSDCPGFGTLPVINIPGTPAVQEDPTSAAVPGIGQQSRSILMEAGYSPKEIDDLISEGIVRTGTM